MKRQSTPGSRLLPASANASPKQQDPRYKSGDDKNPVHDYLSRMTNAKKMRTAATQAIPRTTEIIVARQNSRAPQTQQFQLSGHSVGKPARKNAPTQSLPKVGAEKGDSGSIAQQLRCQR